MRLNLPRHNCISFNVSSQISVSKEKEAEILAFMERTLTRTDEDDGGLITAALYGSASRAGGIPHRLTGVLTVQSYEDGGEVSLMAMSERGERMAAPPREMQSVNDLMDAVPDLFGPIEVSCSALFEYEREKGYSSKIPFPIPLIMPDAPNGITHIESAQFSRRDANGLVYLIAVGESDDGDGIAHSLDFETVASLDQNRIRELFSDAASISSRLVAKS